jgi:branched-subunit amino acid transport protein AzlD
MMSDEFLLFIYCFFENKKAKRDASPFVFLEKRTPQYKHHFLSKNTLLSLNLPKQK